MGIYNNKKIFSDNLIYYMNKNDKRQTDLVNDLGFTKSAISSWCRGARLPRMDKLEVLANYFGIDKSNLIEVNTDKKDLFKLVENFKTNIKMQDNLMFKGKPISKESCQIILDALQIGVEIAKSRHNIF